MSRAPRRSLDSEVPFTTADHSHRDRPNQGGPPRDDAAPSRGRNAVSQTNFLDHVGKGPGYFGTFFNAILMTPPRRQNEDIRHVMAAWDCLAPGGTLVAALSPGWEHPANEMELLLFRLWFEAVHARQENLREDVFIETAPPMQSRLIWALKEPITQ